MLDAIVTTQAAGSIEVNCTPCQGQFQRCESVPLDGYRFYYPRKLFKSTLAEPLSMDSLTS